MPHRIYVDTNCFLHLRDLKDVPWSDLWPDLDAVDVVIAPVVIDELDRLKVEKGGRIRDRSRAALDLIEKASATPDMRLELRGKPRPIYLVVAEGHRIDWADHPRLDPTRQDDHLIVAALTDPGGPARLLSFDTGPLIRGRQAGLTCWKSPEAWALPPMRDEAEEKLARTERELAKARSTRPVILASLPDAGEDGVIHATVPDLPALPAAVQARLLEVFERRHPPSRVTASHRTNVLDPGWTLGGISSSQVLKYQADHRAFLNRHAQDFAQLHVRIAYALTFVELRYEVINDSAVTAVNLRLSIHCETPMKLYASRSDIALQGGALRPPRPPDAPTEYQPSLFIAPRVFEPQPPRDPTAFYWLDRPSGDQESSLVCDEFRARRRWSDSTYLSDERPIDGPVRLEISAANLPEPVIVRGRVVLRPGPGTWLDPPVLRRLPDWMAEVLTSSDELRQDM